MPPSPSSLPLAPPKPPVFRVDIPLLPESAAGSALQLIDLLRGANLLASQRMGAQAPRLAWRLLDAEGLPLAPLPSPLAAYTAPDDKNAALAPTRALFIPSFHAPDIPAIRAVAARHQALSRQLGIALDAGQKLLTMGNGAWLAAQSGRLNGRQACLPWFYIAGFERDFPSIGHSLGQDLSDDGPWMSCALPSNVNLLAIALVHQALGPELAAACETVMIPDHQRARAAHGVGGRVHLQVAMAQHG